VRVDAIDQVLNGTQPLSAEVIAGFGTTTRGMPVIEELLFDARTDLVAAFTNTPRRCAYLTALTADLAARATEIRSAWDPAYENYAGQISDAGRGSQSYGSVNAAFAEIINRIAHTVENIRADKLGRPLGTTSGGVPQPDKIESPFSGRAIEDIRDNLRGIERLFYGNSAQGELGLNDYLLKNQRDFSQSMRSALDASYAALGPNLEPLSQTLATNPQGVQAAIDQLGELQRLIQVDIMNALSISVGFNDSDGD
jgi:predicted lipoprotein